MVQIAISLTCPKVPVVVDNTVQIGDYNFEDPITVTTNAIKLTPDCFFNFKSFKASTDSGCHVVDSKKRKKDTKMNKKHLT